MMTDMHRIDGHLGGDMGSSFLSVGGSNGSGGLDVDERVVAQQELTEVTERLRNLCSTHAPTFVAVERRGAEIRHNLVELVEALADVCGGNRTGAGAKHHVKDDSHTHTAMVDVDVDVDVDEAAVALESAPLGVLAETHRARRRTLRQHSALLELLELPSLMDACVRSNLYDGALDIAAFANALERKLPQKVVLSVIQEVRRRERDLCRALLAALRTDISMPRCLEVVTALRRLNGVELERRQRRRQQLQQQQQQQQQKSLKTKARDNGEPQGTDEAKGSNTSALEAVDLDLDRAHAAMELRLRVDFFEARDAWIDSPATITPTVAVSATGITNPNTAIPGNKQIQYQSEVLLQSIERYRTRTFEIVTQYLAIFCPSTSTVGRNSNVHHHTDEMSLLSSWTTRRIQIFLTSLARQVAKIENSAVLRDALDATLFFATSMGRIGADFTALLPAVFEPNLVRIVTMHWHAGLQTLHKTLRICRDAGVASPLHAEVDVNVSAAESSTQTNSNRDTATRATLTDDVDAIAPPRSLLALPALARVVNHVLEGLNELRRCLLPNAFGDLREQLTDYLDLVKSMLEEHRTAVMAPGRLKGEATKLRENANEMTQTFQSTVRPYCVVALEVALGCASPDDVRAVVSPRPPTPDHAETSMKDYVPTAATDEQKDDNKGENNEIDMEPNSSAEGVQDGNQDNFNIPDADGEDLDIHDDSGNGWKDEDIDVDLDIGEA